jgi:hypothetical protein
MMLTPCWPRAGPTGGAGVAAPAWICNLMNPVTFFFGAISFPLFSFLVIYKSWKLNLLYLVE